ncbi:MAG: hypothetical protein AAFR14_09865 [Bacteroidota bacterium]
MKKITSTLFVIQIVSALIWAVTIIVCGQVGNDSTMATVLITAGGFHVVMLARHEGIRKSKTVNGNHFIS